MQAHTHFALWC